MLRRQPIYEYSDRFRGGAYEYRIVVIDPAVYARTDKAHEPAASIAAGRPLAEETWRNMGIRQSHGWENIASGWATMEPNVLVFRRRVDPPPPPAEIAAATAAMTHQCGFE